MLKVFFNEIEIPLTVWSFPAGDQGVRIDASRFNRHQNIHTVRIRASLCSSDEIMQLLLLNNAIRETGLLKSKTRRILELLYIPYAQQDRVCNSGEAFSAEVMAELIDNMDYNEVILYDPHSNVICKSIRNSSTINLGFISTFAPESLLSRLPDSVIIVPDNGAINRCSTLGIRYGSHLVMGEKRRDLSTGNIESIGFKEGQDLSIMRDKTVVIADDMCLGGGTFIPHALAAKEAGAKEVILLVTHGIFNLGLSKFNGVIDSIYCTDSYTRDVDTSGYDGEFIVFSI